jgi:lipopolysaccharide/colanic/teichoic acid biosynthesis glycosyltransferase
MQGSTLTGDIMCHMKDINVGDNHLEPASRAIDSSEDWSESPVPKGWYPMVRPGVELILAALMLVPAVPLIALGILLIRLTSRGPGIYAQKRVGRDGLEFVLYKIRTMQHDCERHTGPRWATTQDPRVTAVGRFLRRTHLDELPQLVNVLRGEMSLIGPRPERPEFVAQLERTIPHYRDRLVVRPGLTGLAQVQLPPDSDLDGVRRKLACDLHYVRYRGPSLDTRILVATGLKVLGIPLTACCRMCRIPTGPAVEWTYQCWVNPAQSLPRIQTA